MQCDSITVRISHLATQTLLLHGTIPWSVSLTLKLQLFFPSPQASISEKQEDCGDKISFKNISLMQAVLKETP